MLYADVILRIENCFVSMFLRNWYCCEWSLHFNPWSGKRYDYCKLLWLEYVNNKIYYRTFEIKQLWKMNFSYLYCMIIFFKKLLIYFCCFFSVDSPFVYFIFFFWFFFCKFIILSLILFHCFDCLTLPSNRQYNLDEI